MRGERGFYKKERPDKALIAGLEKEWFETLGGYAADRERIGLCFAELVARHTEKGRFYHDLGHVSTLLRLASERVEKIADPKAVRLAIWFHDAVYDPKRADNEEKSARLARTELTRLELPAGRIRKITRMIRATAKHLADGLDADGRLFLDLDLSILGAEKERYQSYRRAIRREYAFVPEAVYRRRRRMILRGFLRRPKLFFTRQMRLRFEARARHNIKNELTDLNL